MPKAGTAAANGEATPGAQARPSTPTGTGTWSMQPASDGTASVRYRGVEVASFRYAFWSENWQWADSSVAERAAADGTVASAVRVEVPALDLALAVKPEPRGEGTLALAYAVDAKRALSPARGGGLEFTFDVGASVFGTTPPPPQLSADASRLSWTVAPGQVLSIAVTGITAKIVPEPGRPELVRVYLVDDRTPAGRHQVTVTIALPDGGRIEAPLAARYGAGPDATWRERTLEWDRAPVDLAFLNASDKPAGKHGKLRVLGDALVFADGTQARFWGTNVTAYALFATPKDMVAAQAKRLASLGYNLVRIHHHDSTWVVPNVFDTSVPTSQKLDDNALEQIDWWVKCLKDEGIYVWMDLHVGRKFTAADGIPGFAELERTEGEGKGFNFVNERIAALMLSFAHGYLGRTNRFTGVAYANEPALAAVLVTNENDLLTHFGTQFLPDKQNPVHTRRYDAFVESFAKKTGLRADQIARAWEPGPAKLAQAELEWRFYQRSIADLRKLGFTVPIAAGNMWGEPSLYNLAPLLAGDVVDVHSYGEAEVLTTNPHFQGNLVSWIAMAQVANKPLTITEWNVPYPHRDRFVVPLFMAAHASLQGWDAPMLYAYQQSAFGDVQQPDPWASAYDPALTAVMPAAAVMFRQGHVAPAKRTYSLEPTADAFYGRALNPETSVALRSLAEQSRVVVRVPASPALAWDDGIGVTVKDAVVVTDFDRNYLGDERKVTSDTGELVRDFVDGVFTIETARSVAAMGWIGKRKLELGGVRLELDPAKATVAVTSLDGAPLASSRRMLVTVVAQVLPSEGGRLPFLAEPISGTLTLRRADAKSLRFTPLAPDGARFDAIAPQLRGDEVVFAFDPKYRTHWYLLEAAEKN